MPRTRKAAKPAEPSSPQEELREDSNEIAQTTTGGLQFKQPLTWRAGRPISVSDLLSRLQDLHTELDGIDQVEALRELLIPKAQELASTQLLAHKDKGVRAWTLLCIVKMFHLLAPDAPYKARQLQDIFTLFATQVIPALADSSDPYTQQYMEILTSFANDKSILLVLDVPQSEELTLQIFRSAFDIMAGKSKDAMEDKIPKNVEYQLTAILTDIVVEAEVLPNQVVDVVLAQFLRADASLTGTEAEASTSPAYDMARAVCNSSSASMTRYVSTYFSSVLVNASDLKTASNTRPRTKKRKHDDSEDEGDGSVADGPTADDLNHAERAHKLLRELWRSTPDVVQGVIPQIEVEISSENVQLRLLAVKTTGDLFAGIGSTSSPSFDMLDPAAWPPQALQIDSSQSQPRFIAPYSFSKAYPDCYQAFLDRNRDKSTLVRSAWVSSVGRIIATNAGGKGLDSEDEAVLLKALKAMLADTDEKVRLAAIETFNAVDYFTLISLLSKDGGISTGGSLLDTLADRVKDPRPLVRMAAITFLAKLWGVASSNLSQDNTSLSTIVGSIPTRILAARYLNLPEVNYNIPLILHDYLLPASFPPIKITSVPDSQQPDGQGKTIVDPDAVRAERILLLFSSLDERAEKVFNGLQTLQTQKSKYLSAFVDQCERVADDKKDADAKDKLDKFIQAMIKFTLEPEVAEQHLRQLAIHNDKRNHQLIRFCVSPESDYRKVFKAMKELQKRLESGTPQLQSTLVTLMPLLKTSSVLLYNRSHVPIFMAFARTDDKGLGGAAKKVLQHIAATNSEVFKIYATELCEALQAAQPKNSSPSDPALLSSLKTCVGFARHHSGGMPKNRAFYQAMTAYALYSGNPASAKCAVSIIVAAAEKKEMYVDEILSKNIKNFEYGRPHFLSQLAAIAQIQLLAPSQAAQEADEITAIAVQKILGVSRPGSTEDDSRWLNADELDEDIAAKLLAVKMLVNGLRGRATTDISHDELRVVVRPVMKLLNTLIEREGELGKDTTCGQHRAQLRLAAGVSLLKLCTNRDLNGMLNEIDFNRLARLCQDPLPEIRMRFSKALTKYLGRNKLPSRFLALLFLYAHDPVKKIKDNVQTWIRARQTASSNTAMENVFARLLSLLAHHQDFSLEIEDLSDTVHYIVYYLSIIATQANLPILYNIAQQLKTVRDALDKDNSDNLYVISDLAEATIRALHEEKGWILQTLADKVRLPPSIVSPLPADVDAQELAEKRFLPADIIDEIPDLVRTSLRPRKKRTDRAAAPKKTNGTHIKNEKTRLSSGTTRKRSADSSTPESKATKKSRASIEVEVDDGTRRRSSRGAATKVYAEMDSDDEDEELERWNNVDDDKENDEEMLEDTPPTSDLNHIADEPSIALQTTPPKSSTARKRDPVQKVKTATRRAGSRSSGRLAHTSDDYDIPDDE